jgi:tryptophan-rich sensory protein
MKKKNIIILIVSIAIPLLVGFASSMIAGDMKAMYEQMVKAPLSPPGWLFGVVWPVMYTLMGIAWFLTYHSDGLRHYKNISTGLYIAQLAANFFWSILFFKGDYLWPAFALIIALDILVLLCVIFFRKTRPAAGNLMIPYFIWLAFATYLNLSFAVLN